MEVVIVSAVRTPIGNFFGSLSTFSATDLGGMVIKEAIRRAGIEPDHVDEVIMGNVLPAGLGQNPARQAMLKAGLPVEVGAVTVNKVCGSGLKAVMLAAQAIQCGDAKVIVAGGMESMSQTPYYLERARAGYRMGNGKIIDGMIRDGLFDGVNEYLMGYTSELISEKHTISRNDQDAFALRSNELALAATRQGKFRAEILPVEIPQRKGEPIHLEVDEGPRETSMELLAKLPTVFKDGGVVTAGNSSKISDGASALVLMSDVRARELGVKPLLKVREQASAGIDLPDVLIAPTRSIPKVLKRAGLTGTDIDLHEINEAFAATTVAVMRILDIPEEKVNLHGGAVALGHPIGASGARVLTTLLFLMKERNAHLGMASLCLGGGEAVSLLVENI
ncbi:MAG: acetyl-CoA C-acetyltransferase [Deltaproteobacteria bacterium]|nr:acetyl-CoA C-acetyltransferase [Deltaproteobacteria bacterium]MBW2306924.1 acetyl-CoA C-acetyltransferase [Deltaproteobacteria bacterium]